MRFCWRDCWLLGLGFVLKWTLVCMGHDMACIAEEPWSADSKLVEQKMKGQGGFNYREADVPKYALPDVLRFENGDAVTAETWPARRAELMTLFREHVYGTRPELAYEVKFDVEADQKGVFDGAADARQIKVRILSAGEQYAFTMFVVTPTTATASSDPAKQPARLPAIIHLNNRDFPSFESVLQEPSDFWPVKQICAAGFVAVAVSTKQIDPDQKGAFDDGIRGFFHRTAGTPRNEQSWAALSAWGWGVSRAVDYLRTQPTVDAQRIAVVGHSRGGKAALWAAAEDPRIAIAYSNNSGCGGAALSRRKYGETVARITTSFPYWFCGAFANYSGREDNLPVDQHQLIALLAPRAVYVTSATEDLWADPRGEYLSLISAAPAFALVGQTSITDSTMPSPDQPRYVGRTGYHIRTGGHGLTSADWQAFMRFVQQLPPIAR